jgi:predicted RNA-binding Zn-ribbon protein involved in translation (DUF1610 family)
MHTTNCKNCGRPIEIDEDMTEYKCPACGTVERIANDKVIIEKSRLKHEEIMHDKKAADDNKTFVLAVAALILTYFIVKFL